MENCREDMQYCKEDGENYRRDREDCEEDVENYREDRRTTRKMWKTAWKIWNLRFSWQCLPGCKAMLVCRYIRALPRNAVPPSS
jgi:hypothetical protein